MEWLNEPSSWEHDEEIIRFTADPHTDFWRRTHCGEVHDDGHFYYRRVKGDFTAEVRLTGDYHELYDQSGLVVRLDESCWMKCGVEYVDSPALDVGLMIASPTGQGFTAVFDDFVLKEESS